MMFKLRESTPTARKPHKCYWCYATIQPGEKYHRSVNLGDDGLYEWLSCVACAALCPVVWEWAYQPDEGVGEDSFAEWAHDHLSDEKHANAARAYLERRGIS